MKKADFKIEFTGERLIPEINKGKAFFYEHLARYLFSCQFVKNKVILDAGCGAGYGSFIFATYGKARKVYGVDLSNEAIQYANQKYQKLNLHFVQDNAEKLESVKNNSIDIASAFEVIEHLNKPDQFLESVKKKLKSAGILIVSTPNKHTYPQGNPYHIKEYYPKEFMDFLRNYFKYIRIFHQCFEFTQNLKEESTKTFNFEGSFGEFTGKIFTPTLDIEGSQYLLAVCSNRRLPNMNTVSINTYSVDGFNLHKGITSLAKQYEELKNQTVTLYSQLQNLKDQLQNLREELDERDQFITILKSSRFYKIREIYHKLRNFLLKVF